MVRIPRTEASVAVQMQDQPTMSPDALTGPGRALQQLGKSISGLAGAFEDTGPSDDQRFAAEMAQVKAYNDMSAWYANYENSYTEDKDPTEYDRAGQAGLRSQLDNVDTSGWHPKQVQAWELQKEKILGRFRVQGIETAGKRTIVRNVGILENNLKGFIEHLDPDSPQFESELKAFDSRIEGLRGASPADRKRIMDGVAEQLTEKLLRGLQPANEGDPAPDPGPVIERIQNLQKRWEDILSQQPPPGPPQGQGVGPQSSLHMRDFTAGRNFRPLPAQNVKNIVLHDVSGPSGSRRLPKGGNIPHYHITFDDKGVYNEIALDRRAPHAVAFNRNSIGIAHIGYEGDKLSPAAIANGAKAVKMVADKFGISPERILTHPGAGPSATKSGKDPREASWKKQVLAYIDQNLGGFGGTQVASSGGGISVDLTAYSPMRGGDKMQGGYAAARPGPDGKAEVRTLADVAAGRSDYVTVAGNPRDYGKKFTIPEIPFVDAKGQRKTLRNVTAVVHDTGRAFANAPEGRFDIPIDRDATERQRNASHKMWKDAGIRFVAAEQEQPPPVSERGLTQYAGVPKPSQVADASGRIGAPSGGQIAERVASRVDDNNRPTNTIPGQQTAQEGKLSPQEWSDRDRSSISATPPGLVPNAQAAGGVIQGEPTGILGHAVEKLKTHIPRLLEYKAKWDKNQQDRAIVEGQLKGEIPFNLYDKDDTKRLDEQYDMSKLTERIVAGDVAAMALAVNNAKTLGYVPPKFRDTLLAMTRDMDPEKVGMRIAGYEMASDIALAFPNAFAGENGGALKREALDYAAMVGTRMGQKDAVAWLDEMRTPAWKKKESENAKSADAAVKKWDEEQGVGWVAEAVADELDQDYTSDPVVESFLIPQMDGEFRAAFRRHFIRLPNAESAKKAAMDEIKGAYAVTRIGGEQRIQKYPVEKHYPAIGGKKTFWGEMPNYDYIEQDVVNSVQQWINERDNVIEPGAPDEDKPQGAAEITMKDIYLVGDDVTRRLIEKRNPDEPPSYAIVFRDPKTELLQIIPPEQLRWSMPPQLIKALRDKSIVSDSQKQKEYLDKQGASDAPQGENGTDWVNTYQYPPSRPGSNQNPQMPQRVAPDTKQQDQDVAPFDPDKTQFDPRNLFGSNQKPKMPKREMSR